VSLCTNKMQTCFRPFSNTIKLSWHYFRIINPDDVC
jgi:hypothetical protein